MKKIPSKILVVHTAIVHSLFIKAQSVVAQGSVATGSEELNGYLQLAINVLSGVLGIAFVISFIFAGYQYMTARENASQVSAAKGRIATLVFAFVLYAFGIAILQWLVPGGIFN